MSAALAAGYRVQVRIGGTQAVRLLTGLAMSTDAMVLAAAATARAVEASQESDRLLAAQAAADEAAAAGDPGAAAAAAAAPSEARLLGAQVAAAAAQATADKARLQSVMVPAKGTVLGDLLCEPQFTQLAADYEQGLHCHPVDLGDPAKHFKVGGCREEWLVSFSLR